MAREHGRAHGLAACDARHARRGRRDQTSLGALRPMTAWPHSRCMRWCIEHADALAESYLESLVRDFVLELGIGRPELQFGLTDGHRTAFADLRVRRHLFEADGLLKYAEDNPSGKEPAVVLAEEKQRHDFLTGFKLGASRLTYVDLFAVVAQRWPGWRASTPTRAPGSARRSTTWRPTGWSAVARGSSCGIAVTPG